MNEDFKVSPAEANTQDQVAIDEGLFVNVFGNPQWVTIRGGDIRNPVLLFVTGAGTGFARMAAFFQPWQTFFTVVQWDQPHAGVTGTANTRRDDDVLSLARIARDGVAVVEFITGYLKVRQIVLLAISGGTMPGLIMVKNCPERFGAYVACGQIVNWADQDVLGYQAVSQHARARGDAAAVAELERIGAPPYADSKTDARKSAYTGAMTLLEQQALSAVDPGVFAAMRMPPDGARYVPAGVVLKDTQAISMQAYECLRDEIVSFDARRLGLEFSVPMIFLQGELDFLALTSEVERYVAQIQAPFKSLAVIPGAGHMAYLARDTFLAVLQNELRSVSPS